MVTERILAPRARTAALTAGSDVLASPFQFLVTGEDNLRVRAWCSIAGVTLTVDTRFGLPDGSVQASMDTLRANSDRSVASVDLALTSGYLLNLVVRVSSGTPQPGQCFVTVDVIRGRGGSAIVLGQMLGGYVTGSQGLAWPGSPIRSSLEGQGVRRVVATDPGVGGGEVAQIVPAGAQWKILGFHGALITLAGGANRNPVLEFFDTLGNAIAVCPAVAAQPPSTTIHYFWNQGLPWVTQPNTNFSITALPVDTILPAAFSLSTITFGIGVNDTWGVAYVYVEEWLTP